MNNEATTQTPAPTPPTTKNETRTCGECSQDYQHKPWLLTHDDGSLMDLDEDLYTCPNCLPKVRERNEKERQALEEEERREAFENIIKSHWRKVVPVSYRETDITHRDYPQALHHVAMAWQTERELNDSSAKLFLGLIGPSGRCKTRVIGVNLRVTRLFRVI